MAESGADLAGSLGWIAVSRAIACVHVSENKDGHRYRDKEVVSNCLFQYSPSKHHITKLTKLES